MLPPYPSVSVPLSLTTALGPTLSDVNRWSQAFPEISFSACTMERTFGGLAVDTFCVSPAVALSGPTNEVLASTPRYELRTIVSAFVGVITAAVVTPVYGEEVGRTAAPATGNK